MITLGVAFSALSSCLASAIGGSRLLFAFSRDGAFGGTLGHTSARTGAPTAALVAVMAVVAIEVFGLRLVATTSVIDVFFWTATMGTLALLVCYVLSTLGAMRYLFFGSVRRVAQWEIVIPIAAVAVPALHALPQRVSGARLAVQPVPVHRRRLGDPGRDRRLRHPRLRPHDRRAAAGGGRALVPRIEIEP